MSFLRRMRPTPFINLFLAALLNNLGFNIITPLLAKYAVQTFNTSLAAAGALAGIFSITSLIVRPVSGLLSDRFLKKRIMFAGTAIIFFAVLGYSVSASLNMLFFFRVLHGVGFAVQGTANIAMVGDYVPSERIGEKLSLLSLAYLFTSSVGPALGVTLAGAFGNRAVFLFTAASIGCSALLILPLKPAAAAPGKGKNKSLALGDLISPRSIPLALVTGTFSMMNGVISSFLVLYADAIGVAGITSYFAVKAIVLIFIRLLLSRVIDRVRLGRLLYPSLVLGIATAVLFAVGRELWVFLAAAVCYAFSAGIGQPAIQAHIIKQNRPERRGVAVSTYYIGADVGQGIGSPLGGSISDNYGYSAMYGGFSIIFILGIAIFTIDQMAGKTKKAAQLERSM